MPLEPGLQLVRVSKQKQALDAAGELQHLLLLETYLGLSRHRMMAEKAADQRRREAVVDVKIFDEPIIRLVSALDLIFGVLF